jgi:hypothetical protein
VWENIKESGTAAAIWNKGDASIIASMNMVEKTPNIVNDAILPEVGVPLLNVSFSLGD